MLQLDALATMKVMVAVPCYGFLGVSPITLAGLWKLSNMAGRYGLTFDLRMEGDSHVDRARNKLVAKFLAQPEYTHLMFVDADVGFTPEALFRLLLADKDVVLGAYPLKRYEWPAGSIIVRDKKEFEAKYTPYPFAAIPGKPVVADDHGFAEILEGTTGFMCIKAGVFDVMRESYPHLNYIPDWTEDDGNHWWFFDAQLDPVSRRALSEDYAFCRYWRLVGGQIFMDLNSKLDHQGAHIWHGDLLEHLRVSKIRKPVEA